MKVVDNRTRKKEYTFESLLIGTVFNLPINDGECELCLKISNFAVFSLDTDTAFEVTNDLKVEPIKAYLVLED